MEIDYDKVSRYWDNRLQSTEPLSAVLSLDAPVCLNEAYDKWERYSLFSSIKSSLKNKKVLDVGAGYGRVSLEFAQQSAIVSSVDSSQKMLNLLEQNAKILTLNKNIKTFRMFSDKLSLSRKFDIIICFGLLEHLSPHSRNATIRNCFSHLKKSGKFYTIINNSDNLFLKKKYNNHKNSYNGYQSNLIGINWLNRICKKNDMKTEVVASNPNYAILHYYCYHKRLVKGNLLTQMSINALRSDMLAPPYSSMAKLFASHFMVRISHIK
jgi:2-polyprenyl-3-methyl-5-hydroxy-6-metoxy-1,4-benzoquinol methylase